MIAFIDDHRQAHGVEPICRVLPIALSTAPHRDQLSAKADANQAKPDAGHDLVPALKPPHVLLHVGDLSPVFQNGA